MLEEREVAPVIVSLAVGVLFVMSRRKLAKVPHSRWLMASFGLLAASLACSLVEVLAWGNLFNAVQHVLAPTAAVAMAIWSWLTFARHEGASL